MISSRTALFLILGLALAPPPSFIFAQEVPVGVSPWLVQRLRGRVLRPAVRRNFDDSPSVDNSPSVDTLPSRNSPSRDGPSPSNDRSSLQVVTRNGGGGSGARTRRSPRSPTSGSGARTRRPRSPTSGSGARTRRPRSPDSPSIDNPSPSNDRMLQGVVSPEDSANDSPDSPSVDDPTSPSDDRLLQEVVNRGLVDVNIPSIDDSPSVDGPSPSDDRLLKVVSDSTKNSIDSPSVDGDPHSPDDPLSVSQDDDVANTILG